jgi:hypothetical protein
MLVPCHGGGCGHHELAPPPKKIDKMSWNWIPERNAWYWFDNYGRVIACYVPADDNYVEWDFSTGDWGKEQLTYAQAQARMNKDSGRLAAILE